MSAKSHRMMEWSLKMANSAPQGISASIGESKSCEDIFREAKVQITFLLQSPFGQFSPWWQIFRACNHPLHSQRRANVFTSMNNSDNQSKWEDVSFFSVRESIQWTIFFAICVFASVWASFICYWHFVMVDCWYNGHGSKSEGWEIEEFVTVFFFDQLTLPYRIHGNAKQGKAAFRVLTKRLHFYICN